MMIPKYLLQRENMSELRVMNMKRDSTPTIRTYVYRLLVDTELKKRHPEWDEYKRDILNRRIQRHKDDIVRRAVEMYRDEFEILQEKET